MTIEDIIKELEKLSFIFGDTDGGWWYESRLDELIDKILRSREK